MHHGAAWRRQWHPTPVLLPGKSHGWRSVVGCSPWGQGGHNWATSLFTFHFHALEKEMATHSSVLAWRIPGMGEPGGQPSLGSHRVGHDWSDLAAVAAYWKLKTQWFPGDRMVVHVLVVYFPDGMDDWKLWLAVLPSTMRKELTEYHKPRKRSKFKIWSTISIEGLSPSHHHKVKKS